MGDGYPMFEWDPGIEISETMGNYEEEISWLVKKFQFNIKQHYEYENWRRWWSKWPCKKGELFEYDEQAIIYSYMTEEDE